MFDAPGRGGLMPTLHRIPTTHFGQTAARKQIASRAISRTAYRK